MTYSIVARDPTSGRLGVAVQSRYFSVGSVVTWAEAGVGAVATQSMANPDYGPQGIALMRAGRSASDALAELVAADDGRELRQVAMIDAAGNAAAHTGKLCIAASGHIVGDGFSVQANMMVDDSIWPAMHRAYTSADGDLADRLLAALDAAQAAGGDIRGQQSAAMLIVEGERNEKPWRGVVTDLRVEDHLQPLEEIRRLLRLSRAYRMTDAGDEAVAAGSIDRARTRYERALELAPENDELQFWAAVGLFRQGQVDEASALFRRCFAQNAGMADLVPRLVPLGLVRAEDVGRITALRQAT
jgi:uncharacterized Ntn-hydrolase superfamily protein